MAARRCTTSPLTVAHADNSLTGNGLQEQAFSRRATTPASTRSRTLPTTASTFVNLTARHDFDGRTAFSGNAYYRNIRTDTLNGDINEDSLDQALYQPNAAEQAALAAAGYTGFPTSGANAIEHAVSRPGAASPTCCSNDEPAEKCNGLINRTRTLSTTPAGSGQLTWRDAFATAGAISSRSAAPTTRSSVVFGQSTELGYLNPDRSVTGLERLRRRRHRRRSRRRAVRHPRRSRRLDPHLEPLRDRHAVDRHRLAPHGFRTLQPDVDPQSRSASQPGGGPGSLDGDHDFRRFNPAAGLTFSPSRSVNFYAGYSEGSRAATSIELGCANPE